MTDEDRCARCELLVGQCEHTRTTAARRANPHDLILISPARVAHLPGCHHNNPADFVKNWAEITGDPRAWERIGNGIPVPATGGAAPGLVAVRRCDDC
ncbi:hypothetical protein ABZ816_20680 [Actinosynnema sp. NPDC047251]|uniref:Uncharacterized protein n=1 Tax=Saccharothrix espanaensis (strain ATCC 51144 / DSM 44229 / JCM 9112 / NBRC 15066 / NRRL 15764) TaxID=1179773 RepID=K0K9F5_SACES|nr:hypothetical protein [Saccharothrix espanaensis]CCH34981.1 hypothetical protein BN6_77610 [Saccharothrix espanaensis DSM 44229]